MLSKNQIKEIQSLQLKKIRDSQSLFLAEGIKTVTEIIENKPALIKELFATQEFIESHQKGLATAQIKHIEVTGAELGRISLQHTPNHTIAVCYYLQEPKIAFDFQSHFSLYLDDIRDPGNFGTLLRLADWYGISTLFCSPGCCDLYNPKVIQASMGAFLRVNVVYAELEDLRKTLRIETIYGAVLNGDNLYKKQLNNGLIVIGNEANGIRDTILQQLSQHITIPAHRANGTESLNAAIAASIIVSEFFRQLSL